MALSSSRTVRFSLSKALSDDQAWASGSFSAIVHRATGYSERWALREASTDEHSGIQTWQYHVEGVPDIDLVVDHIIHELTDAVLLDEWHSVAEDRFTFGSMRRDRPERPKDSIGGEAIQPPREETPS